MQRGTAPQGERALHQVMDGAGLIIAYPVEPSERLVVLQLLAEQFELRHMYSEREVNALIRQRVHASAADPVTVRRDLIDYQLLHRTDRGTRYWRDEPARAVPPQLLVGPGTIGPDHVVGERETK